MTGLCMCVCSYAQVLEVPAYRERADLDWLVHVSHLCLDMTSAQVGSDLFKRVKS